MTSNLSPFIQWFITHPDETLYLTLCWYSLIAVCTIFACIQLWLIRAATEQARDETLHSRLILTDLLKVIDQSAAEIHKKENKPSADSPSQDRH